MFTSISFFQTAYSCFFLQITPPSALDKGHSVPMASVGLQDKKEREREKKKVWKKPALVMKCTNFLLAVQITLSFQQ